MSGINAKPERLITSDQALAYVDYYRSSTQQVAKLAPQVMLSGPGGVVPRRLVTIPPPSHFPDYFPSYPVVGQSSNEYTVGELSGRFKYTHQ
jgi:hypothetical protein